MMTISWLLTLISIVGAIFNAKGSIIGFYLWLPANIGWVIYDLAVGQPAASALFAVYSGITIYGIYQWRKQKK